MPIRRNSFFMNIFLQSLYARTCLNIPRYELTDLSTTHGFEKSSMAIFFVILSRAWLLMYVLHGLMNAPKNSTP